ncbi:hypothetical protein ACHWQZ_G014590 [Mnemiopsis leidyi]
MLRRLLEKKDLQLIFILLVGLAADVPGWTAVRRGSRIPLDLENTPLEIKTESDLESGDVVSVYFYTTPGEDAGGVWIYFTSTPQYWLYRCTSKRADFPCNLPAKVEKVWRITVDKTAGIRVKIHGNSVEVVNVLLSDTTCSRSSWKREWSRDIEQIYFSSNVPNYYRAAQTGDKNFH